MEIKFTLSAENAERVKAAMLGMYGPIPETCEEVEGEEICTPDFTEAEWAKEAVRRLVIRDVRRWEHKEAREAIDIKADDDLLS